MAWTRLDPPVRVRAFVVDAWHDAIADDIESETREIRIRWPPEGMDLGPDGRPTGLAPFHRHRTLEASRWEAIPDDPLPL